MADGPDFSRFRPGGDAWKPRPEDYRDAISGEQVAAWEEKLECWQTALAAAHLEAVDRRDWIEQREVWAGPDDEELVQVKRDLVKLEADMERLAKRVADHDGWVQMVKEMRAGG